ncbi:hypothetical protein LTS15_006891 [Exophiala xenobiotica]|nr:hypothetical protein LTS15_006891 [Exophiala xenobiotica]
MQAIPPGHWAYGYLRKEAEGKEQEAKQLYREYTRKVKSAEYEKGQFDEDSTEVIRLRKHEIQPIRGTGAWYGSHHYPPAPYKWEFVGVVPSNAENMVN